VEVNLKLTAMSEQSSMETVGRLPASTPTTTGFAWVRISSIKFAVTVNTMCQPTTTEVGKHLLPEPLTWASNLNCTTLSPTQSRSFCLKQAMEGNQTGQPGSLESDNTYGTLFPFLRSLSCIP
jgi:hypothetical protein